MFNLSFTEIRAFTLLDCFTHWCTCSPSKVILTRSQLPTEEIAAGSGMSGRKSWQYHAVQLFVGTSLKCHWPRSRGIPRHLSLRSSPRLGFLHVNRLYAGAQCMIGLLVGGSASCPSFSGEFSTYHFCLGQVLSKCTTKPYWLCLGVQKFSFWHYTHNYLSPVSIHNLSCLSPTMLIQHWCYKISAF